MCNGKVRVHFESPPTLLHRFIIEVRDAQCIRQVCADDEGERIQALCFSQFSDALAIPSRHDQMPGIPVMSSRIAYLLDIDWMARVKAGLLPLDHPLLLLLAEPRRLGFSLRDGVWVR